MSGDFHSRPLKTITAEVRHPETDEWITVSGWYPWMIYPPSPDNSGTLRIFSGPEPHAENSGVQVCLTESYVIEAQNRGARQWAFGPGSWRRAVTGEPRA